jgi:hypothetical protein
MWECALLAIGKYQNFMVLNDFHTPLMEMTVQQKTPEDDRVRPKHVSEKCTQARRQNKNVEFKQ